MPFKNPLNSGVLTHGTKNLAKEALKFNVGIIESGWEYGLPY